MQVNAGQGADLLAQGGLQEGAQLGRGGGEREGAGDRQSEQEDRAAHP